MALRKSQLPELTRGNERSAFKRGAHERNLRVLVDVSGLADTQASQLLQEMTFLPEIETLSFGPYGNASVISLRLPDPKGDNLPYVYAVNNGRCHTALSLFDHQLSIGYTLGGRMGVGKGEAVRAWLVAAIANHESVDTLITADTRLLCQREDPWLRRSNVMDVHEGLGLIGLFLRSRSDFTVQAGLNYRETVGKWPFFWGLGRGLLPASWAWYSACLASSQSNGDPALADLGEAAIRRLDQALRARDRLHEQSHLEQDADVADEILYQLDMLLLSLSGALDAVARVAHLVYGLSNDRRFASWRGEKWLKELAAKEPLLSQAIALQTSSGQCLTVLSTLRNSIHGERLRSVIRHGGGQRPQSLVIIPDALEARFLAAVTALGGPVKWGIDARAPIGTWIDASVFIEELVPRIAAVLNRLMSLMPVQRFPGVDPTRLKTHPPEDDMFGREAQFRIRCLAGM